MLSPRSGFDIGRAPISHRDHWLFQCPAPPGLQMATQSPCLLSRRASCDFGWHPVFSHLRYSCESLLKATGHPIHENNSASILCLATRYTRTSLMASSNTQKDRFESNVSLCKQVFPDSWSKNSWAPASSYLRTPP